MPMGEGKGWAKGRTADGDPRIARNAERHRGMTYVRHLPPGRDRRFAEPRAERSAPLEWSNDMAYVVGLMATDGCLIARGARHLAFDSQDEQLVRTFLRRLGRPIRYRSLRTRAGGVRYQAQFSDAGLYRWLQQIGLTPRKSLTLGAIAAPTRFMLPLLRGLLDGDGHISNFVHRPTPRTAPTYVYERLWVFFNSASRAHLEWVRSSIDAMLGIAGHVEAQKVRPHRHPFFRLKYGNRASVTLLQAIYPDARVPKLERKWAIWSDYARRHAIALGDGAEGGT